MSGNFKSLESEASEASLSSLEKEEVVVVTVVGGGGDTMAGATAALNGSEGGSLLSADVGVRRRSLGSGSISSATVISYLGSEGGEKVKGNKTGAGGGEELLREVEMQDFSHIDMSVGGDGSIKDTVTIKMIDYAEGEGLVATGEGGRERRISGGTAVSAEELGIGMHRHSIAGDESDVMESPLTVKDYKSSKLTNILDSTGKVRRSTGVSVKTIMSKKNLFGRTSSKIIIQQDHKALDLEEWEYPGWGNVIEKVMPGVSLKEKEHKHQLDLMRSTAIAGNDLLASVLYTTGIVCGACGQLAPIAVFLCSIALLPFVKIFKECGTALPLNGGVYIALLNSSSKIVATFAATCSLISYAATAVVSASSTSSYAAASFGAFPMIPVTIAILAAFGLLVLGGVKDSANIALTIFSFHILTLAVLVVTGVVFIIGDGGAIFFANMHAPLPVSKEGGVGMDLWIGFSVALLGLTGFETSANYIEEAGPFESETNKVGPKRKVSVFERTISSMYLLVFFVNPSIVLVTLGVCDLPSIVQNAPTILSLVGLRAGGEWLKMWIAIDALMVLMGGVLTAYVGVIGLVKQLASDRCLPSFLLYESCFKTHHWIILSFFALCTALYLMTGGDVTILGGVFSVAFLMVLLFFAFAVMKLKMNRPRLPRGEISSWTGVLLGMAAMIVGLIGNVYASPVIFKYFILYAGFFFTVILIYYQRMVIAETFLFFLRKNEWLNARVGETLVNMLREMREFTVLFFTNTSELHILNKAIIYAKSNECCNHLIIAHVWNGEEKSAAIPTRLKENLQLLDHLYPKIKIDLLLIMSEEFNPKLVKTLAKELDIPPSFMFIRCPGRKHYYHVGEFEGVRTIMK